jgi:hypothetical protein
MNAQNSGKIKPVTIGDVDVGTTVQGEEGYSLVKECVHGNKFYAFLGVDFDDADTDDIVAVSDDDTYTLNCCN